MARQVLEGFNRAWTDQLPVVSSGALYTWFKNSSFTAPEMRNDKTRRSCRLSYGDNAIGYVQVRRDKGTKLCQVAADITAEHRVRKRYMVHCVVDEATGQVLKARCEKCPANKDGCKHAVAFVSYLHRRSEEPPTTAKRCLWRRSRLAGIGRAEKSIRIDKLGKPYQTKKKGKKNEQAFFEAVQGFFGGDANAVLLNRHTAVSTSYSIHHLMMQFKKSDVEVKNAENFIKFCSETMTDLGIAAVADATKDQSLSKLWFGFRQGRVTASRIDEVANCKTSDGYTRDMILGAVKVKDSKAMARGRELEPEVRKVVAKKYPGSIKVTGIMLSKSNPIHGASPDGIHKDFVLEIKCPNSEDTFKKYFVNDFSAPAKKYKAQVLLNMHFCNKKKGLFCVAAPDFEKSKKVTIIEVPEDPAFLQKEIADSTKFWSEHIFPILFNSC